jgi:hypothetical protein
VIDVEYNQDLPVATITTDVSEQTRVEFLGGCLEAAQRMVECALGNHPGYTRLEFDAAKYVIEYAIGKPGVDGAEDKWEKLLKTLVPGVGVQATYEDTPGAYEPTYVAPDTMIGDDDEQ